MRAALPRLMHSLVLVLPLWGCAQQPQRNCDALQAEVVALRARVKALEKTPAAAAPTRKSTPALPGTAARPAAIRKVVVEEPYSRSGCKDSLFKTTANSLWQDPDQWLELSKGQAPAKVEALLGPEHFDERGGDSVVWHYGRCGKSSAAQLLFIKGKLSGWRAPAR